MVKELRYFNLLLTRDQLYSELHNLPAHPVPKENLLDLRQRSNGGASAAQETKSTTRKHSRTEQPFLDLT